jgi:hypothetical protein
MTHKQLVKALVDLLKGGKTGLRFDRIARHLNCKQYEVEEDLYRARKRLEQDHTPTMLVTEFYFVNGEPQNRNDAERCCALHGRAAVGIRRLFIVRNDLLGQTWLRLNQRSARGIQACNLDRIAVEHHLKLLTTAKAQSLVNEMREAQLPYHEDHFAKLMGKSTAQLKDKK